MDRDIENNFDAFNDYVSKYNLNEKMIEFKYYHSYRVMKKSEDLARSLKLSKEDIYLASLIGLLHDIGRFEQWTTCKTFKDTKEFNHAEYGVKVLFEDGLINNFICTDKEKEIIKTAVLAHNAFCIPNDIKDERTLMFIKIIRDSDKLDIIYSFSSFRTNELKESDDKISEEVKETFFKNELLNKDMCKNPNDFIIFFLNFVFDINYDYTIDEICINKYYEKMFNNLKNKRIFSMYFESLKYYLEERIIDRNRE